MKNFNPQNVTVDMTWESLCVPQGGLYLTYPLALIVRNQVWSSSCS